MSPRWAGALLLATSACGTMVPLQTASAVDHHRLRVGGQLSASAFCGSLPDGPGGLARCTEYPDGVPLPELRANARYGVAPGADLGGSLHVLGQVAAPERALQVGLTTDVKKEVFRRATEHGPTHIVSLGLQAGLAGQGRVGLPWWGQLEWGVPLFYGAQFQHWELVLGAAVLQRTTSAHGLLPTLGANRVGLSAGVYRRHPAGLALQLGYLADPAHPTWGTLQLQAGTFFDLP